MQSALQPQVRVLQHVPRWTIIRTIRQQSVAEHSYYVAIYATYIAKHLQLRNEDIIWVTHRALTHDFEEMISGDIPTPYKKQTKLCDDLIMKIPNEMAKSISINQPTDINLCKEVIKVADLFEAAMYLSDEINMGNSTLEDLLSKIIVQLEHAANKLDGPALCSMLLEHVHKTPRTRLCSDTGF